MPTPITNVRGWLTARSLPGVGARAWRYGAGMSASHPGSAVELRWAAGEDDRRQALTLREQVFCDEQGVPRELEVDGLDDRALHLLALPVGCARTVGTLRLLVDGVEAKVGRVAVAPEWRSRG